MVCHRLHRACVVLAAGITFLAKGQGKLYISTEAFFHAFHVVVVLLLIQRVGLDGAAIAFSLLYFVHTLAMLFITKLTIDFRWSRGVHTQIVWMFLLALVVFTLNLFLNNRISTALGGMVAIVAGTICLRQLILRIGSKHRISRAIKKMPLGRLVLAQTPIGKVN